MVVFAPNADAVVWDTLGGQRRYEFGFKVTDVGLSSDGHLPCASSRDKRASVFWVETGAPAAVPLKHPDWVNSAELTPDSRYLITTCRDQMVRLWDWQDPGKALLAFEHTKKDAINARVSPDGNWIIAQSTDRAAQICDRQTGQAVVSSRLLFSWIHPTARVDW